MSESNSESQTQFVAPNDDTLFKVLTTIGQTIGVDVQRSDLQAGVAALEGQQADVLSSLVKSAEHASIFMSEMTIQSASEAIGFLREGFPVVIAQPSGGFVVLQSLSSSRVNATIITADLKSQMYSKRQIRKLLLATAAPRTFVCKKELQCDAISAVHDHHHDAHDQHREHPTPLRRFLGLLDMDRRDIASIVLFAFVAGVLALATPLAIESLVNVVSWGTYLQPLIVLGLMLLVCLGLAGILKLLQTVVVELIQRRQFVRIVSDLAHRFPRANQVALIGEYPRELANRVFDIMTIQKATAVLLLDGVSIVLTTVLGMVLLAFYHPFLLGFDIVLLISMISITSVLGRGGIRTAIDESITKYRVVHWLQDVLSSPSVFKTGGGELLAIGRANQLTADYISARQLQFRVVLRQITFAIMLQVLASTAVLALGGWLVINGQLTLGQLVASELVVTVVVGAFAKAGKSLEKFYDLMAGVDKVGHLIDIPADPRHEVNDLPDGPASVTWGDLLFRGAASESKILGSTIDAGSRVAIVGDDVTGRRLLARALAGLATPGSGLVQVAGYDAVHAASCGGGKLVGYAGINDIFHGTLRENVDLGRSAISQSQVREALRRVGLADVVLKLPGGLTARLQTQGYPLDEIHSRQLVLARAMLTQPRLLIVDGLLDDLASDTRKTIWDSLTDPTAPWTLVINTNRDDIAALCETKIAVHRM